MSQTTDINRIRWTSSDLELMPDNGNRYEINEVELFVTRAPDWGHQKTIAKLVARLDAWSEATGLGEVVPNPGIIFSDADNVIPDVVWASKERLAVLLDRADHLTGAPELVVEVLSPGNENERRDRSVKLKLYSTRGVQEYWLVNWQRQQVEVYQRRNTVLELVPTLSASDELASPTLPKFSCLVGRIFS